MEKVYERLLIASSKPILFKKISANLMYNSFIEKSEKLKMTIYSSGEMLSFVPPSFKKQTNLVKAGIHVNVKMSHCTNNVQSTEQFILPMNDSGKKDLHLLVLIFSEAQYFIATNNDKSNEFIAEKVSKKLSIPYEDILAMLEKLTREDAGNTGGFAYLESYSVEIHSGDGKMLKFSN